MAGKNVANPTAMLLCAANFLEYAGLGSHGDRIRGAVQRVLKDGRVRTKDLVRTRGNTESRNHNKLGLCRNLIPKLNPKS